MSDLTPPILLTFFLFFAVTLTLSLLINSLFLKFSHTLGIRDKDKTIIRWSAESKPSFGGISFYIIFLFSLSVYSIVFEESLDFRSMQFAGFLFATTIGFLMGLYDDAYNTNVLLKLMTQIFCGLILIGTGTYIQVSDYEVINYILTLLWVVGIMNSVNMLDNMDAITTLVSIGILITFLVSVYIEGDFINPYYLVILGLLAALSGFLFYNWHPSKMFMGDTGSQFLGILLAALSIMFLWNSQVDKAGPCVTRQGLLVLVVFALPLIDTTTVFIRRIRRGQSPFVGGKDHTTHHLSYLGLSDRQVALVFLAISASNTILGISILFCCSQWTWLPTILYLAYFLVLLSSLFYLTGRRGYTDTE